LPESYSSDSSRKEECSLCGLPVGRSGIEETVNGELLRFCCHGCLHVFQILFNSPEGLPADFRKTELYQACVSSGLIAGGQTDSREITTPEDFEAGFARELSFKVEGMWCTACSWLVKEILRRTEGVLEAEVFFLSDLARIKYLPHRIDPREILERISKLGYRAVSFNDLCDGADGAKGSRDAAIRKDVLMRLGVSAILTMNVMMLSFALYAGFFHELGRESIRNFSYTLCLLATPVVFYGGFPILKRAVLGLRFQSVSMDTLIAVGTLSAYVVSVIGMYRGSPHLYFDTASMLVTLVLLGKFIEARAREQVSRGVGELFRLAGGKARLCRESGERWVASDAVGPGDELLVLAGERVPVDARIIQGQTGKRDSFYRLDESILTGESRPTKKSIGDEIPGGALLLDGEMRVRATRVGSESSLNQMISLTREALTRKNPVELLADRITHWLVPAVLVIAAVASLVLWAGGLPADEALLRAVTVLVITCPCALGIATPLAKVAAIEAARSRGILVRDPTALEKVKDLDVLVFDKTGTLTEGSYSLREVVVAGGSEEEALRRVAAVESHSDHFLAREILRKARERGLTPFSEAHGRETMNAEEETCGAANEVADHFQYFEGLGARGNVQGEEVMAGNRRLMTSAGLTIPDTLALHAAAMESRGSTIVFYAWEGEVRGLFVFGDIPREGAREAVSALRSRNIALWLASGDSKETTGTIAKELGIYDFVGGALPSDKVEIIRRLQKDGHRVGMIGDGINDAAALAQADVGFSLGAEAGIVRDASDITLLAGSPAKVLDVLELSVLTTKIIRQNLFFAFLYNVLGIPLAIAGALNPLIAVFAMLASSLTVIGNTLRITRSRRE